MGVDLHTNCQEIHFSIPEGAGEGEVAHFRFQDGLSNFIFDGQLKKDWQWEFSCEHRSPLYFFFLQSGVIEDVREGNEKKFELHPMQTLMVMHPGDAARRSIVFKAGERIKVSILSIRREIFLGAKGCGIEDLPTTLQWALSMSNKEFRALFPPDRITLETATIVQEIIDCPYTGLMRNCFIEAQSRRLLLAGLKRSNMEFIDPSGVAVLEKVDLKRIMKARSILQSNLQKAPTIEELSRQIGLNRQKLKVDFKATFGKTIYQFLREERMNAAKGLLMEKNCSVQEVAAAVGYENTSHFSRRFQEQFGILPSKFSTMIWRNGQEN